jgi:hypothetical protein
MLKYNIILQVCRKQLQSITARIESRGRKARTITGIISISLRKEEIKAIRDEEH